MKASDLKPGNAIVMDGNLFAVVKSEMVKPGKGGAFAQLKLKNLQTGQNIDRRFRSTEDVEGATLDKREIEFLYPEGDGGGVFMDAETYEQSTIRSDILGDALLYTKPNERITASFYEGNPVSVELPASVDLEVTDTPPGIKNATATNQLKEATLETGLKTRVPPFINIGEKVKVTTTDGSYLSRVSE